MGAGAGFGLLVGAIILIGILAAVMRGNYEKTLRALATPLGLTYERLGAPIGVGHVVRGYVDGRAFELAVVPEGRHARSQVLAETWKIQLAGVIPGGFTASKNGWTRRGSPGMYPVGSGDADFDRAVYCEALNPHEAQVVLDRGPRSAALRDLAALNALVHDNKVMLHKSGFDNNLVKLQARLERLRAIARCIDPIQPQPPQPMQPAPQLALPPPRS